MVKKQFDLLNIDDKYNDKALSLKIAAKLNHQTPVLRGEIFSIGLYLQIILYKWTPGGQENIHTVESHSNSRNNHMHKKS